MARQIIDGRKVVAAVGTRERLVAAGAGDEVYLIRVTAETDNTGVVVVGADTVVAALATRRGTPLAAGESVTFEQVVSSDIWLDVTVAGEGVTFMAET